METKTEKLMDIEAKWAKEHQEKLTRIVNEIEKIFLKECITMGDFLEVMDTFNKRSNRVFEKITLKKIKEDYDRQI